MLKRHNSTFDDCLVDRWLAFKLLRIGQILGDINIHTLWPQVCDENLAMEGMKRSSLLARFNGPKSQIFASLFQ